MIKIQFYNNGLVVSGHANYAEHGSDIVCAGVSSIVLGALNWFIGTDAVYEIAEGYVYLQINKHNSQQLHLLDLLRIQLTALDTEQYAEYLSFEFKQQDVQQKGNEYGKQNLN